MERSFDVESKEKEKQNFTCPPVEIVWLHCAHEFLAMLLFVFVCCGSVAFSPNEDHSNLSISLTFGLCITVLVYATAHTSGGQVNSAVTVALMTSGDLNWAQGLCNIAAQIIGSICGALLIWCAGQTKNNLGMNQMPASTSIGAACLGEFMGTFLLCWTVFQTAVTPKSFARSNENNNPILAPFAIGLSVFLAHMVLIPLTSCSINFPRSFGPAIISMIDHVNFNGNGYSGFWIYFVMPHVAGGFAGLQNYLLKNLE